MQKVYIGFISVFQEIYKYRCYGKKTSAAGFEPARENPADFESASLTTRTY